MLNNSVTPELAQEYVNSGLSVIPIRPDGSKAPAIVAWKPYQTQKPKQHELAGWFHNDNGIAIICGSISGNLEILDVDAPELFEQFCELLEKIYPELIQRLPIVMTPGPGYQICYRCVEIEGNQKLAVRKVGDENGNLKDEVLFETRGEGGYVVAPPSPSACHPNRRSYELISGNLMQIPTITLEERNAILDCARAFNEKVVQVEQERDKQDRKTNTTRLGNDFNSSFNLDDWNSLLSSHGWRKVSDIGEKQYWKKPGKTGNAVSATLNFGGSNLLYVFSTSASPFEADKPYKPFAAYALLEHNGDFKAAAKELIRQGYGSLSEFANDSTEHENTFQGEKVFKKDELVRLAQDVELFCDADGNGTNAFATLNVNSHFETYRITSKEFKLWLTNEFRKAHQQVIASQPLQDAINTLTAKAVFDVGVKHKVCIRIGELNGKFYYDLGDESWRVVEIDSNGWRILDKSPVKFIRPSGHQEQVVPIRGGNINELRKFINVTSDDDWTLFLGWLLSSFRPSGPYAVLSLAGTQDATKSTTTKMIRLLLDPSTALVRAQPKEERDLMVGAKNNWLLAFDNLSHIPEWLSDALCRLSTGGGQANREHYTNGNEYLFDAMRPVVMNGIEELATRPDLVDRAIYSSRPNLNTIF